MKKEVPWERPVQSHVEKERCSDALWPWVRLCL